MGKGIAVVFVYSAILLGLFGVACYLMTQIDPPWLGDEDTSPLGNKTTEENEKAAAEEVLEEDGRRLGKAESTTCFSLTNVNVTITPLVTTLTGSKVKESNLTINATAKERRSIHPHPLSAQKSGDVIMEIADDEGSPRFEILFYPKHSMKQSMWRRIREEESGELQSEGHEGKVAETVHKSVIRIMADDTITLEESDKIMSAESTAKDSNNEAQILIKSIVNGSGYEMPIFGNNTAVDVETKESADDSNIQNVQNHGPSSDSPDDLENQLSKFADTITLEGTDNKRTAESSSKSSSNEEQVSVESVVNSSGYEMRISLDGTTVDVEAKESAAYDSNIQNVQNQEPSGSPDDLENNLPKSADTVEAPITTEKSAYFTQSSGFDIKLPLSTESLANSSEASVPILAKNALHELGTITSLVSASNDSDVEASLSAENAAGSHTNQDVETQQGSPSTIQAIEHLTVSVIAGKSNDVTETKDTVVLDVSTKDNVDEQLSIGTTNTISGVDRRLAIDLIETGVKNLVKDSKDEGLMISNSIFKD